MAQPPSNDRRSWFHCTKLKIWVSTVLCKDRKLMESQFFACHRLLPYWHIWNSLDWHCHGRGGENYDRLMRWNHRIDRQRHIFRFLRRTQRSRHVPAVEEWKGSCHYSQMAQTVERFNPSAKYRLISKDSFSSNDEPDTVVSHIGRYKSNGQMFRTETRILITDGSMLTQILVPIRRSSTASCHAVPMVSCIMRGHLPSLAHQLRQWHAMRAELVSKNVRVSANEAFHSNLIV